MRNAVVLGATTHVGFALCQTLINKEVEVTGLTLSEERKEESEEKLMEIGRNAFFHYKLPKEDKEYDVAFICLEENNTNERENYYEMKDIIVSTSKVFVIGPDKTVRENEDILSFFRKINKKEYCMVTVPMLFGPWQPVHEVIHKKLLEQVTKKDAEEMIIEENDAIYVEDVANALYEIARRPSNSPIISLVNEECETINLLAKRLGISLKLPSEKVEKKVYEKEKELYRVTPSISVEDGLEIQKRNMKKRLNLYS